MTPGCRPINHSWEWLPASLAFRWFQGMEGDPTNSWCWRFMFRSSLPSKHAQGSGCCHCMLTITGPGGISISLMVKLGTKVCPRAFEVRAQSYAVALVDAHGQEDMDGHGVSSDFYSGKCTSSNSIFFRLLLVGISMLRYADSEETVCCLTH